MPPEGGNQVTIIRSAALPHNGIPNLLTLPHNTTSPNICCKYHQESSKGRTLPGRDFIRHSHKNHLCQNSGKFLREFYLLNAVTMPSELSAFCQTSAMAGKTHFISKQGMCLPYQEQKSEWCTLVATLIVRVAIGRTTLSIQWLRSEPM